MRVEDKIMLAGVVLALLGFLGSLALRVFGIRAWQPRALAWFTRGCGLFGVLVGALSILGVIIWLAYVVVSVMIWRQFRLAEQKGLMWTLTIASERRLPLTTALESYALECSGGYASRLRRVIEAIDGGTDVASALEMYGRLPRDFTLAAHVGQMAGQLGPALREYIRNHQSFAPLRIAVTKRLLYFFIVFVALEGIGTFFVIQIFPKFRKICEDFGVDLNEASPGVQTITETIAPAIGPLVAIQGVGLAYLIVASIFRIPLPFRSRRLDTVAILRALAFFTQRELSIVAAFRTLAMCYPRPRARRGLEDVCSEVEGGADWVTSLRSQRLLRESEVVVIKSAQRVGNLPWALSELADSAQRRYLYRWRATLEVISPWLMLAIGALVMYVVVACFYPLVLIIEYVEKS